MGPPSIDRLIDALQPELAEGRAREADFRHRQVEAAFDALESILSGRRPLRAAARWQLIADHPERLAGHGTRLAALLSEAKDKKDFAGAMVAASLLGWVPLPEFTELEDELLPLLGSRILALHWHLTPDFDVSPLPRNCPRWGTMAGFGLLARAPGAWERLGELGPRAVRIVAVFIEEVGERPPLVVARDRLRLRGLWLD